MAKRITITLTATEEKAIKDIMEHFGFTTASAAISLAVTDYLNTREYEEWAIKWAKNNLEKTLQTNR